MCSRSALAQLRRVAFSASLLLATIGADAQSEGPERGTQMPPESTLGAASSGWAYRDCSACQLESRWRWTGIARAARLIDNAADSPVVQDKTQLFLLMSVTRRF
jgi:hypothetical protein